MKYLILLLATAAVIGSSSCRRCYFCQIETPIVVQGDTLNTHVEEREVCGKSDKEDSEDEGFICTRKN